MTAPIISTAMARRLAINAQVLGTARRASTVLGVAQRIRCIQFDPINAVARTQLLVLFSRLGTFDPAELDRVLYEDKTMFAYWAHAASFVLTEDYAIHAQQMRGWPGDAKWAVEVNDWMEKNKDFQRNVLRELKKRPMRSKEFARDAMIGWRSSGWTNAQTATRMLDFMWVKGHLAIAGRQGIERVWARSDLWFPPSVRKQRISKVAATRQAVIHSLRALGVATRKQISLHFVRGQYQDLPKVIASLIEKDVVTEVVVVDQPGTWYMLAEDLHRIDEVKKGWRGRTTLLSPFDNLICDRDRTEKLFDFDYRIEIYVPKAKRKYGYYVLPIIDGDKLVGRIDSTMDRKTGTFTVNNLYVEEAGRGRLAVARRARSAIQRLASWLGATDIAYGKIAPTWRPAFKD